MSTLSDDIKDRIRAYIPRYPSKQAVTLPALHLVHDEYRTVSNEAMVEIAALLDLHPSQVHDTMTFYEFFKHDGDKLGKTRLWVCRGLACMLRGAYDLQEHCEHKLGVKCGERTADGKITLEFADLGDDFFFKGDHCFKFINITSEKSEVLITSEIVEIFMFSAKAFPDTENTLVVEFFFI